MSEEDERSKKNNNVCHFCGKNIAFDKVRDRCHSTSKCRGPAHIKCIIDVTQKQSEFIQYAFQTSIIMIIIYIIKDYVKKRLIT